MEVVSRQELVDAVEAAVDWLDNDNDKEAVREFARTATRFAAGAWRLSECACPISAVGIDRMRGPSRLFAGAFDTFFDISSDEECMVFEVTEEVPNAA